jgi:chorismate mutase
MTDRLDQINQTIQPLSSWIKPAPLPWVIAGPCSAETERQVLETARLVAKSDHVVAYRAGVWKPRTRPDSFEGIGEEGLKWLAQVKAETGLATTTEVANARHVELCLQYGVDILWIGARTTINSFAVQEIANALRGVDIPVMIKNPVNAHLAPWIGAIERIYEAGIRKIAAIHRGFSVYLESGFRNRPQWQIPIELQRRLPNLPMICDPSHIAGKRELVEPVAQMALDIGISGLMIESHIEPEKAWSDAAQQVTPATLMEMLARLHARGKSIGNTHLQQQISQLRGCIEQVDDRILQDLSERMRWVEQIGRIKQENDIPVLQIDRWENLLEDHLGKGRQLGLDEDFVKALFELIHLQAVKKQVSSPSENGSDLAT